MSSAVVAEKGPLPSPSFAWLSGGRALALVAGYFVLQTLLRTLVSDSAELDESEQLLFAQEWRWGYGSEAPLYTWLQIAVFHVFGTSVLGLAVLKNLLLFSAFAFTYLSAREMTGDERISVVAMFSLAFFPQIAWESQRDLTHSVLATALAAATFYAAARTARSRAPLDYLLLGFCLGFGALSKYSYSLFAVALGISALTVPSLRRALLGKWLLLTLGVFLLITAWHFQWIMKEPGVAWQRPAEVIGQSEGSWLKTRMLGGLSIAKCTFLLGTAITAVYGVAFRGLPRPRPARDAKAFEQWIVRTLLLILLIGLGIVLATGVELRDRWFQPIVFLGAISAAWLARNRLGPRSEKRCVTLAGAVGLIVLIVLPGIPLSASVTHRPTRLNAPYSELTRQLQPALAGAGVIVAANRLVGGNLHLFLPRQVVAAPEFLPRSLPAAVPWLVVWDASKSPAARADLVDLARQLRGVDISGWPPAYVEAPYKYARSRTMKLGYVTLPVAR
jgi:4-amino-4-deoxy-L-arabinose transferase-like glycosyltransferase